MFFVSKTVGVQGIFFSRKKLTSIEDLDVLANREAEGKDYIYNFIFLP